jgi:ubiquinone/menaquinone biosynthesis C-methylase UbiE
MRVLDIGCGSGDVSRLAAQTVGESGWVVGIDRDEGSVRSARARTPADSYPNVSFEIGHAARGDIKETFDALVGRFVLMHQDDPAGVLAAAARSVRPRGIVVIIESHMAALLGSQHSVPHSPIYDEVVRWKCGAVKAAGADIEAGLRLRQTFLGAGLSEPTMRLESAVEGGAESRYYRYVVESIRSMLPQAAKAGISGMTEDRLAHLETQLRDEVVGENGSIMAWPVVAAWCIIP